MANALYQNPIKIDSTFSANTSYKSVLQVAPNTGWGLNSKFTIRVSKILWYAPVTAADTVVITDPTSSIILWEAQCVTPKVAIEETWNAGPIVWNDFTVGTIASGVLFITLA